MQIVCVYMLHAIFIYYVYIRYIIIYNVIYIYIYNENRLYNIYYNIGVSIPPGIQVYA